MKRRDFFATAGAGYLATSPLFADNPFRPRFQLANSSSTGKTLVALFQRGGNDGLNTIVPYFDEDYYARRPNIAVPPPDNDNPAAAIDLDGNFGMHPALAAFEPIYQAGDMAILPTVHYPNASRSHFDGIRIVESAASSAAQSLDGWLNRHLAGRASGSLLQGIGFIDGPDSRVPPSLRGDAIVSTFSDLTSLSLGLSPAEESSVLQRLLPIYQQAPDAANRYERVVQEFGQVVIESVQEIGGIDFAGYTPSGGAVYPSSSLGNSLKQTAQLIKEGVGLEVAAISTANRWDHHRNQGGSDNPQGRHYRDLAELSEGLAAFYHDLGSMMSEVVVLTMTEFGRSANENGSGGTSHGNASTWLAIGGCVNGGIYLGSGWPGLATENLYMERYLAHTVDYRDVYGEVLTRHLAADDLSSVLPGHTYTPVGFLDAGPAES